MTCSRCGKYIVCGWLDLAVMAQTASKENKPVFMMCNGCHQRLQGEEKAKR